MERALRPPVTRGLLVALRALLPVATFAQQPAPGRAAEERAAEQRPESARPSEREEREERERPEREERGERVELRPGWNYEVGGAGADVSGGPPRRRTSSAPAGWSARRTSATA